MTAIPCGQKNSRMEMIQSQIVMPPLAAIDGTTFRLKTATTNSNTRSQRPRTRFKCGCELGSEDKTALVLRQFGRARIRSAPLVFSERFSERLEAVPSREITELPIQPGRGARPPNTTALLRRRCVPAVLWRAPVPRLRKLEC